MHRQEFDDGHYIFPAFIRKTNLSVIFDSIIFIILRRFKMKILTKSLGTMLLIACLTILPFENICAQTTDRAYSIEYFTTWWYYDGTAEFNPSYKIPSNAGYDLRKGKYVKQSYVNYTRKKNGQHVSVIGGRSYSKAAPNKNTNATYKAEATAKDSINIVTNQTHFWYGWLYF